MKKWKYSNFYIWGPRFPEPYLDNEYGHDWRTKRYKIFGHIDQKFKSRVKEDIPESDYQPAKPFFDHGGDNKHT